MNKKHYELYARFYQLSAANAAKKATKAVASGRRDAALKHQASAKRLAEDARRELDRALA